MLAGMTHAFVAVSSGSAGVGVVDAVVVGVGVGRDHVRARQSRTGVTELRLTGRVRRRRPSRSITEPVTLKRTTTLAIGSPNWSLTVAVTQCSESTGLLSVAGTSVSVVGFEGSGQYP